MQEKTKNKIVVIVFVIMLLGIFLINLIKQDTLISESERRKLAKFPEITFEKVVNGKTSEELEKYTMDQFIGRDFFGSIKSFWSTNIFKQKDSNGLFKKENSIYKIEYPLKQENIQTSASKIKNIYDKYLKGMNVYYAIIPDKNHYLENDDHLKLDYEQVEEIMKNTLTQMEYIPIENSLTLNDYYRTDLHWKQESIGKTVETIENGMNLKNNSNIQYEQRNKGTFYGAYYGQLGQKMPADEIIVLTNDMIENCTTYNYETQKYQKVYDEEKWKSSSDKYDIYLSGATPLIEIENPNSQTDKELLLFRDSYGSSIAPLLINNYRKIVLVDLRYIHSSILNQYISFKNQDVLFLYSTLILNQNVIR